MVYAFLFYIPMDMANFDKVLQFSNHIWPRVRCSTSTDGFSVRQCFILWLENVKRACSTGLCAHCITLSKKALIPSYAYFTQQADLLLITVILYVRGVYQIEVNLFTVVHDNGSVRGHKQHIVSLGPFFIKEANVKYKTIINCKKRGLFPKRTIGNLFSFKELKSRTGQGSAVLNILH